MPHIIGIDLGTTNSCAAVWDRRPLVIESAERERTTPSVVGEESDGSLVVGAPARWQAQTNPEFTYSALKRLLGRRFEDPLVGQQLELAPYIIEASPDGWAWVRTRQGLKSPQEILAHVLRKMKGEAEARFKGGVIGHAVLCVPAHFDTAQREAAKQAAGMAGLEVMRLLPEPTAAALAYGFDRGPGRTIAIFDFGGGTFDVTIMRMEGADFQVLAMDGDPFLGGEDFDRRILLRVFERFEAQHGIDLRRDRVQLQRLRDEAEKTKIKLSSVQRWDILAPFAALDPATGRQLDLVDQMDRDEMETLCADLIERARAPCMRVLKQARLDARDLDDVVLVGGMTAMPALRNLVREVFGREPRQDVPPEEAVATGAAILAATLEGQLRSVNYSQPTERALGVEDGEGAMAVIVKAKTPTPVRQKAKFTTVRDNQERVAVRLREGDLERADDCRDLGLLVLDGIAPAAAGEPTIEVVFDIDNDQVMSVSATDTDTGQAVAAGVHVQTGLTAEEFRQLKGLQL